MAKSIACAPLTGTNFEADARRVHQMVRGYVQGEHSEQWVKELRAHQNGRADIKALRRHFSGEGNATRRIADAKRLRDTIHYRNERSLPFELFLPKVKEMFNLYAEHDEPYTEKAKLRFLFEKVQCPTLLTTVQALEVKSNLEPESVSYDSACNILAAKVAVIPENSRRVAAVSFGNGGGGSESIYRDGKIHTGYYKAWNKLSKEDKDKVMAERLRTGDKPAPKKRFKRKVAAASSSATDMKELQKELKDAKRTISALSRKGGKDDNEIAADAGNSFGGRASKKAAKEGGDRG